VRRLIVNADDFGLTAGVNRAIVEAHQKGIVTSATLMACGHRFQEAVASSKGLPRLSVGCHVVLVDGQPASNPSDVPSLKDGESSPQFRKGLTSFALIAASGRLDPAQVEAEIAAQIIKLQSAGLTVSHLDSHKHTHMFPSVLKGMLHAAKQCGVPAIRNPFEPLIFARLAKWKRQFQLRMMSRFRTSFRRALNDAGVTAPDGCVGVATTGGLSEDSFLYLIENLPPGTWELVTHPGYNDAELDGVNTRLRQSREKELAILTSATSQEVLRKQQVELISYRDL